MKQRSLEATEDAQAAQIDLDTWRILKKALKTGLFDRGFGLGDNEASLIMRFMLEHIENSGLRVVPVKPTTKMQLAIQHALDSGKRMSIGWVRPRTKQRWRYQAAIEAAPNWRQGYEHERREAEGGQCHSEQAGECDDVPGRRRLAERPAYTADNIEKVTLRDLNFKVDSDFHTKFKMTAAAAGKSMKELFEECYEAWVKSHSSGKNDQR